MTLRQLWILPLLAALLLSGIEHAVDASALAFPPGAVRMVIFNAIDGSNLTNATVTVQLNSLAGSAGSMTRSILFCNDAATDATGNSDLLADLSGSTIAAAPTNGVAGSAILRVLPGEKINIDGQFTILTMRSRSTSIPVRVIASY